MSLATVSLATVSLCPVSFLFSFVLIVSSVQFSNPAALPMQPLTDTPPSLRFLFVVAPASPPADALPWCGQLILFSRKRLNEIFGAFTASSVALCQCSSVLSPVLLFCSAAHRVCHKLTVDPQHLAVVSEWVRPLAVCVRVDAILFLFNGKRTRPGQVKWYCPQQSLYIATQTGPARWVQCVLPKYSEASACSLQIEAEGSATDKRVPVFFL